MSLPTPGVTRGLRGLTVVQSPTGFYSGQVRGRTLIGGQRGSLEDSGRRPFPRLLVGLLLYICP